MLGRFAPGRLSAVPHPGMLFVQHARGGPGRHLSVAGGTAGRAARGTRSPPITAQS